MKRTYEQVAFEIVLMNIDVITSSGDGQQSYESDNVVSWWEEGVLENGN